MAERGGVGGHGPFWVLAPDGESWQVFCSRCSWVRKAETRSSLRPLVYQHYAREHGKAWPQW